MPGLKRLSRSSPHSEDRLTARADANTSRDGRDVKVHLFRETLFNLPRAMLLPLVVGLQLSIGFWASPFQPFAWAYAAFALSSVLVALGVARLAGSRRLKPKRAEPGLSLVTFSMAGLGILWGTMPIVFLAAHNSDAVLTVATAEALLIANTCLIGPFWRVGAAYAVPLVIIAGAGFVLHGSPSVIAYAAALPVYAALLIARNRRVEGLANRRLLDGLAKDEQAQTIDQLLLDLDEASSDWIWHTDTEGRFVSIGAKGVTLPAAAVALQATTLVALLKDRPSARADESRAMVGAMRAGRPFRNKLIRLDSEGQSYWLRLSGAPLKGEGEARAGYQGVATDMTAILSSEARITQLSNYDALTGLVNRTHFAEVAREQCAAAGRDGLCRALLLIDLDRFRAVNDRFGHRIADDLLRQVAERLRATAPEAAAIARLGADEFAIWLAPSTPTKAEATAGAVTQALSRSFTISDRQVDIGASIGVAFTPKHTLDPDELLVKADLALDQARAEGKGGVCVFRPALEAALIERRILEGDLQKALARNEFLLHFQPIVDVVQGHVVSFETLIRWQSPARGLVAPGAFIPAAEATGLITPIGRWVLFEACRIAATWPSDVNVAVNISPPHLRSPNFLRDVTSALKTSGLHPSRLEIEVTESVFLDSTVGALETLKSLRTKGIRIALDDFGTGYSSLNYLVDFPVDKIKIDRSFIRDLTQSEPNQAIVEAILGLARKLSIRVTAEGIETKDQALALKWRRCDELQGYLFSRPQPADDVPAMLAAVPLTYRDAVPAYTDSPLAVALTSRRTVTA
jgi:diguanylate cyclase (GGDEF)-like protein